MSGVLEGIGRILAGMAGPMPRALLDAPGLLAPGPCLVPGTVRRCAAADAAQVMGAAAPGLPMLAALLALAEEEDASGRAVLAAHAAGVAQGGAPAAACAQLLGLDADGGEAALRLAAAMAPAGSDGFGLGARAGLVAARLVQAGLAALPDAEALTPAGDGWKAFTARAGTVLPRDAVAPLHERLETLEEAPGMRAVMRLMERPAERAAPRFAEVERHGVPLETSWVP